MSEAQVEQQTDTVDLTPSPRVLQMLGRIEFELWQCLAEFIDNSIDAITETGTGKEIWVDIPTMHEFDEEENPEIKIGDDGPGMSKKQLEKNLKAGYSGNDPISKLGLFGMGFNISTARLGEKTTVKTTRKGDEYWKKVVIDLEEMQDEENYEREIELEEKDNEEIHGTRVKISNLKNRARTINRKTKVRRRLNRIYTPILHRKDIEIEVGGERLTGRQHCVWDKKRTVRKKGEEIPARIEIEEKLGEKFYCKNCWNWLQNGDEEPEACPNCGVSGETVKREQKMWGWVGIQRFFDEDDYGIDLIRNGRVIEAFNKSFFYWEDPETGEREKEYPIDTTHWGGRIVGEIHINFIPVTYTKDSFEKKHSLWKKVRKKLRGEGPFRPQIARRKGYPKNESPLGKLFSGYRSGSEVGKKMLVPGRVKNNGEVVGMNEKCKEWAEKFWDGKEEYQDDTKWWEAVENAEMAKRKSGDDNGGLDAITPGEQMEEENDEEDDSEENSPEDMTERVTTENQDLSRSYTLNEYGERSLDVEVALLEEGELEQEPVETEMDSTSELKITIDPEHPLLTEFSYSQDDLVLIELSRIMKERIDASEVTTSMLFSKLKEEYFPEDKISPQDLSQTSTAVLDQIKDELANQEEDLPDYELDRAVKDKIRERVLKTLRGGENKVEEVLKTTEFINYAPHSEVLHLLEKRPELFLDGRIIDRTYKDIGTESLKQRTVDEISSYLSDLIWLAEEAGKYDLKQVSESTRMEIVRASYSLRILRSELSGDR